MKNRLLVWRTVVMAALTAVGLLAAAAGPHAAHGQIPGGITPDVQVIVVPLPTGQWGVSSVYPKQVARPDAHARLTRLLMASQWRARDVVFENGQLTRKDLSGSVDAEHQKPIYQPTQAAPVVMSSLSFATVDNPVDLGGGTMVLEPFALGFRDLSRIHITYLVPKGFVFHGLRHFENADLSVDMMGGGEGAYTYVMNIKNHALQNLVLPKTEPLSPARANGGRTGEALWKQQRLLGGGLVVIIALVAGTLVYLWAQRLGGPAHAKRDGGPSRRA